MVSKVALVKMDQDVALSYRYALDLIGGVDDLNQENVTVKVGIYDRRNLNFPTVQVVQAVVDSFTGSRRVLLVESDNHSGEALERLQVWKKVFSERVVPFSLSDDREVRQGTVCGEVVRFSHVLFEPNPLVSLHVLRKGQVGCIFKNLLGLIPDIKKDRFHDKLGAALIDIAEAVGWIDLAVIDATHQYSGEWKEGVPLERKRKDLLVVGRDAFAVETVGCLLAGENPLEIPVLAIAKERNLGETDIDRIDILGEPIEKHI